MANLKPWEESYIPREWKLYQFTQTAEEPVLEDTPPYKDQPFPKMVASSSEGAERLKEDPERIYFDDEQIMAGLDDVYGVIGAGYLTSSWRGHKAGALVMQLCTRHNTEYSEIEWTYMVEVLPETEE